jgi:hypothetical protein
VKLSSNRPEVRQACAKAEAAFVASTKRAYADAWRQVKAAIPRPGATGGDVGGLRDPLVLGAIADTIEAGVRDGAAKAAIIVCNGHNAFFEGKRYKWAPLDPRQMLARYNVNLDRVTKALALPVASEAARQAAALAQGLHDVGGIKSISQTVTGKIVAEVTNYYHDPEMSAGDLENRLAPYLSPYKADQVGITETTRLNAIAENMTAQQLNAPGGIFDTAEDEAVCSECDGLDQTEVQMDDPATTPPLHTGCRCGRTIVLPDGTEEEQDDE